MAFRLIRLSLPGRDDLHAGRYVCTQSMVLTFLFLWRGEPTAGSECSRTPLHSEAKQMYVYAGVCMCMYVDVGIVSMNMYSVHVHAHCV